MAKKVYFETVKSKLTAMGFVGGTAIGAIILYMFLLGSISNVSYSGNMACNGTIEDPCIEFINFTADEDIFVYPINSDPWNRSNAFEFDENIKSINVYRSWGKYWREIPLTQTCKGTWCGGKYGVTDNAYSYAFRKDRDYELMIQYLKIDTELPAKVFAFSKEVKVKFYSLKDFNPEIIEDAGQVYAFGHNYSEKEYHCIVIRPDVISCDKYLDSNGDGQCQKAGGESCIMKRFIDSDSEKYIITTSNSEPPKIPSTNQLITR